MNERIASLAHFQWERLHHPARIQLPENLELTYRDRNLSDVARTTRRLCQALSMETPYLFENEIIAFTRTVPNLPRIYDDVEWAAITETQFIHELGNVSNLSPDYDSVISVGLVALREKLGDGEEHIAMRDSIDAVLDLTKRYEAAARAKGYTDLADVLARVPASPPRTFREALQSLRILHYALWCEGDYHNTLGRFDQYMYPYYKADIDAVAKRAPETTIFNLTDALGAGQ